ncbi:ABC transporter ATP-binding protein [Phototrophicus methaneseepsis]|uniref:ABC transporter ATP-binding protein n=1 Tax=Phototrophicus methaneseepsis TaxID=2710758 RepID=A0A7S8EBV9_9CHLR|nr:ABC transporter ATP-binding protein [Phototrophicus methaneseepsis]QPC84071.1 ABC transporter ATP-binding protein [Phototrophicus methaneseepsis]
MTQPLMELKSIYKSFSKGRERVPVLQDVDLKVNKLEFLCLVGESGCGKTTTGKILSGLLKPTSGSVSFDGQDISKLRGKAYQDYRRSVQIIHQDPYASLNPAHTIYSTLSFPLLHHKLVRNKTEARKRVLELLETVDLTPAADVIDKYPHELSGGQRQRVSIARALTTNPSLIVADESVSMVDVSIRIGLLKMLMNMRTEFNVTIVLITHDLALAKYFAWEGRLAVMYLGRVVEVGKTQDIIANPQHPYTRVLLSAIPEADPERTRNKQHINLRSEDIPSLTELPPGCSFHPRCPWFVPGVCDTTVPQLKQTPYDDSRADVACIPLTEGKELALYES